MRQTAISLLAIPAALAAAASACAAPRAGNSASATGMASATVVQATGVQGIAALDFGQVRVPVSGAASVSVGISRQQPAGPGRAARFAITSDAGRHYTLTIPRALELAARPGPGGAGRARIAARLRIAPLASPLGATSADKGLAVEHLFAVGGRLDVAAGAHPGRYRGDVPVTIVFE